MNAAHPQNRPVVTENSVRSENIGVPIIREIMVATTMSSLFVALFALLATRFRTRAALQAEILPLRHQLAVSQQNAPCRLCLGDAPADFFRSLLPAGIPCLARRTRHRKMNML
jgi:hypothetical protein